MTKFKKGGTKPANSGRKKGTANKKTLLKVDEYFLKEGKHPVEMIIERLPDLKPNEQVTALLELLAYCQPKLKPVEIIITDPQSAPNFEGVSTNDLKALARANAKSKR